MELDQRLKQTLNRPRIELMLFPFVDLTVTSRTPVIRLAVNAVPVSKPTRGNIDIVQNRLRRYKELSYSEAVQSILLNELLEWR